MPEQAKINTKEERALVQHETADHLEARGEEWLDRFIEFRNRW